MNFCGNCGAKLMVGSKFCSACGSQIKTTSSSRNNDEPEGFMTKPKFNAVVVIARHLPIIIFLSIWSGIFFGIMSHSLFRSVFSSNGNNFLSFFVLALIVIPTVIYVQTKKNYEKTTYEFLPNGIIYYDGFWTRTKKELKYNAITEIGYKEGILQRNYNLGDLILSTPATDKKSGLTLTDIENIEEVFMRFKKNYESSFS